VQGSGRNTEGNEMPHRLIKRNLRTMGDLRFPQDRRSGIERRHFSYAAHIPERRSGTDRRDLDEHRKEWIRVPQFASTLKKLYGSHVDLVA
jgi:hypothetical protein